LNPKEGYEGHVKTLLLEGEVVDRFVYWRCRSPINRTISHNSFLGQIVGNGSQIIGQTTFYNVETSEIEVSKVAYSRYD
jgi:hypothetical protein